MSRNYKPKFEVIDGKKKCTQCGEIKPISEFHQRKGKHLNGRLVYMAACKKCAHKCTLAANKKRPDHADAKYFWMIKQKYGLLQVQYFEMLDRQKGVCAICKTLPDISPVSKRPAFHVDHCHNTGRVRGLLCANCNTTLGHAKDSIDRLIGCAIYLENFYNNL